MSFKVIVTDVFWSRFRQLLSITSQERVLDLLERMCEDPSRVTDRSILLPFPAIATKPMKVRVRGEPVRVSIAFQYGADEMTLFVLEIVIFRSS